MYNYQIHQNIKAYIREYQLDITDIDNYFYSSFIANISTIQNLYYRLYGHHQHADTHFNDLLKTITKALKLFRSRISMSMRSLGPTL